METAEEKEPVQMERQKTPNDPIPRVRGTFIGPGSVYTYNAARMYAVNAAYILARPNSEDAAKHAAVDADRAMACLTEAVAFGFMDADRIKSDPDIEILREREDFKKLIAEVEAKTKR